MLIIELLYNLAILISLSTASGIIHSKLKNKNTVYFIMQGVLFGCTALIGMLNPFIVSKGIIFDGRSIIISVCTLFFGPVSGIITVLITGIYRIHLGGAGTMMGLLVILFSFFTGLFFYNRQKADPREKYSYFYYYKFGFIVHVLMLIFVLALPSNFVSPIYNLLTITIICVFPIVTVIISSILQSYRENDSYIEKVTVRENLFHKLFELSPAGILLEDLHGKIIDFNEAFRASTGYLREELLGTNIRIIVPPEHHEDVDKHIKQLKESKTLNHDVITIRKDHTKRQIQLRESLISLPDGTAGVIAVINDITDKKIAEDELRRSEERFRKLFEESLAVMLIIDPERSKIIDANSAAVNYYGWPREKLLSMSMNEINTLSEEDLKEKINLALNKDQVHFEFRHRKADGSVRDVEVFTNKVELQDKDYLYSIIHDITDRKKFERSLYNTEQRLRELLENTTNLFYSHTREGILTYISPQCIHFLGCQPEEALKNWKEFITDNRINNIGVELTRRAIETGKIQEPYELELKKKNGELIWVEVHEAPVVKDGQTISIVGTLTDITSRKEAQERNKKTELQYRNLFERANDAIIIFDPETEKILEVNNKACDVYGFTKEEFCELSLMQLSTDIEEGKAKINETVKTGSYTNFETEHKNKDGSLINILVNASLIEYDNKPAILSIHRDITQQKISAQLIISSEKKYRYLFDNNPQPMWIYDADSLQFLEVNEAALNHYGYTKEEFLNMTLKDIRPAEDVSVFLEQVSNTMGDNLNNSGVWRHVKKNGEVIFVEIISHLIYYENRSARLVLANDVTQRKNAENHIRTLSQAVEQSPVSVIITDPEGKISYVNQQFTRLTGYTYQEVLGKSPGMLKSGNTSNEVYKNLWETVNSGGEWRGQFLNKKKNGEIFWADSVISPLFDSFGKVFQIIGIQEDITEKKKMIDELIKAKEKAEEMNRLKSNFLSNMSHELRTPLIGILGYTEMMLSEFTDQEHLEMAEVVHSSGKRLHQTLNHILDLARIEASRMEVNLAPVDISEMLNRLYILFYKSIESSRIDFQLVNLLPGNIVNTDDRIIESIINNLLSNAVKFTYKGSIVLKAEKVVFKNKDYIKISVTDTGIGISEENQKLIFEEFRQASEGYSRKFEGTGLGLSIAKKFTELIGGEITLKSKSGEGSEFSVFIPPGPEDTNSNKAESTKETATKDSSQLMNCKILLVDDDPVLIDIVQRFLKSVSLIDFAKEGKTALDMASVKKYDLILLDIGLRGNMDGVQVFKKLREFPEYSDTPIIACTAFAMKKEEEKFLAVGFTDYISKPFSRKQLNDIINKNLNLGKLIIS